MCPPVVVGFECLLVPLLRVLRRKRSYRRPLLRVPGFNVGSNFECCSAYSTYAGGSCDSNVPFCGRCNTQLHVGLFAFLPLGFLVGTPLGAYILHEAWLRGLFLRFLRRDLESFLPMCPLRLGQASSVVASILVGVGWLPLHHGALSVVPSYGCSLVGDLSLPASTARMWLVCRVLGLFGKVR